jgi:hypothetical protein
MAEASEAQTFFMSLTAPCDTSAPLRWSFLLCGAAVDQIPPLMEAIAKLGFTEIEPMADEEQEGRCSLWFAEVCIHTADSFGRRVAIVEQLAAREGLVVSDYSAEWEKPRRAERGGVPDRPRD